MDLTSLQYELSQATPFLQVVLLAWVLMLLLFSTWFWSVTLDRLFDRIGARLFNTRTAPHEGQS
jgi:hypothetical protein